MDNLTLRQLRYVDALARHGHFGRAAAACAVSQPALSVQVRDLETALGAALFERSPREVRLTAFGRDFTDRARDILQAVDELQDFTRAARDRPLARLRLGVIPTVAPYLLPRLVARLTAAHPGLDLALRETITPKLLAELLDGRLDAAVVALPVSEPALAELPLFTEDFVLVRPAPEANLPVPGPDGLATMRLLLLEEGHCFRDQALSFCRPGGAVPRDLLDGSSLATLVQMVGAGLGVTLIPEMAVPVETRSADVTVARFPAPAPARTIGLVWRRTNPLARQFAGLAASVRQAADAGG
jgi:LysR family hydrogen peroxide-inducible transcriptional activator